VRKSLRRARVVAVGLRDAFGRGLLRRVDVSVWMLAKFLLWIVLVYGVYAAVLSILAGVLSTE
jgi:hypothetical protein